MLLCLTDFLAQPNVLKCSKHKIVKNYTTYMVEKFNLEAFVFSLGIASCRHNFTWQIIFDDISKDITIQLLLVNRHHSLSLSISNLFAVFYTCGVE